MSVPGWTGRETASRIPARSWLVLMSRRTHIVFWLTLVIAVLAGALWWCVREEGEPVVQGVPRRGGLNVTLLAASDLHFGSTVQGIDDRGKQVWIDAMPVRRAMDEQMK